MTRDSDELVEASALGAVARNRLLAFTSLLTRWNATIKLVSDADLSRIWARHVDDALQLVPYMPSRATEAVDFGSGGGFPGLVLALATDVHFDLIEADGRKAAFLREAVSVTRAPATIHASRIEDVDLDPRLLVTARALAPLPKLLALSERFLADGGVCLFPKGESVDAEIAAARTDWIMDMQQISSRVSPASRILRITDLRRRAARST